MLFCTLTPQQCLIQTSSFSLIGMPYLIVCELTSCFKFQKNIIFAISSFSSFTIYFQICLHIHHTLHMEYYDNTLLIQNYLNVAILNEVQSSFWTKIVSLKFWRIGKVSLKKYMVTEFTSWLIAIRKSFEVT